MTRLTQLLGLVALVSSQIALAGVCDGISLSSEIQIIGVHINPIEAKLQKDGSIDLNVYERVIPTKLGMLLTHYGKIRLAEGEPNCTILWEQSDSTRVLELVATSPQGDWIMSDVQTPIGLNGVRSPTLIFKNIQ